MKTCSKCKIEKSPIQFFKQKRAKDGLQSVCKECSKINNKNFYLTPKGKSTEKKYHTRQKGVYGAFEKGKCLYVGESSWLYKRICIHISRVRNPEQKNSQPDLYYKLAEHNHIVWGMIEETDNHVEREKFYIDMYKPVYNNI